jgi:hypothetical protein
MFDNIFKLNKITKDIVFTQNMVKTITVPQLQDRTDTVSLVSEKSTKAVSPTGKSKNDSPGIKVKSKDIKRPRKIDSDFKLKSSLDSAEVLEN